MKRLNKCFVYRRNSEQNNYTHSAFTQATSLVVYLVLMGPAVRLTLNRDVRFYRELPGVNPTVTVSWFIAKAYLANFYYTQRHYKAAIEMCKEVVEVYKHSTRE